MTTINQGISILSNAQNKAAQVDLNQSNAFFQMADAGVQNEVANKIANDRLKEQQQQAMWTEQSNNLIAANNRLNKLTLAQIQSTTDQTKIQTLSKQLSLANQETVKSAKKLGLPDKYLDNLNNSVLNNDVNSRITTAKYSGKIAYNDNASSLDNNIYSALNNPTNVNSEGLREQLSNLYHSPFASQSDRQKYAGYLQFFKDSDNQTQHQEPVNYSLSSSISTDALNNLVHGSFKGLNKEQSISNLNYIDSPQKAIAINNTYNQITQIKNKLTNSSDFMHEFNKLKYDNTQAGQAVYNYLNTNMKNDSMENVISTPDIYKIKSQISNMNQNDPNYPYLVGKYQTELKTRANNLGIPLSKLHVLAPQITDAFNEIDPTKDSSKIEYNNLLNKFSPAVAHQPYLAGTSNYANALRTYNLIDNTSLAVDYLRSDAINKELINYNKTSEEPIKINQQNIPEQLINNLSALTGNDMQESQKMIIAFAKQQAMDGNTNLKSTFNDLNNQIINSQSTPNALAKAGMSIPYKNIKGFQENLINYKLTQAYNKQAAGDKNVNKDLINEFVKIGKDVFSVGTKFIYSNGSLYLYDPMQNIKINVSDADLKNAEKKVSVNLLNTKNIPFKSAGIGGYMYE